MKHLVFLWLVVSFGFPVAAQTWSRAYTGLGNLQVIRSLETRSDGSIVLAGSFKEGRCVVEVQKDGAPGRARCFSADEHVYALPLADGYLIYGSEWHLPENVPGRDRKGSGTVGRLDQDLNVVWSHRFGGSNDESVKFTSGVAAADGGFLVAGVHGPAALVVKLRANGTVEWQRRYDLSEKEEVAQITAMPDGGLALAGSGRIHPWVLRLNAKGDVMWQTFSGLDGEATSISAHPSGGVAVGGAVHLERRRMPWIALLDAKGSVVWQRVGDIRGMIHRVFARPTGSIGAFAGIASSGVQFLSFTASGDAEWRSAGLRIDWPYIAAATADGFVLARQTSKQGLEMYRLDQRGRGNECVRAMAIEYKDTFASATSTTTFDLDRLSGGVTAVSVKREGRSVPQIAHNATCEVFAGANLPLTQPVVQTAAEQGMLAMGAQQRADSDRAWNMLQNRQFAALEQRAAELRKSRETYSTGFSKLVIFYEGLSAEHESLTEAEHLRLLSEWRAAAPRSATAAIASAEAMMGYAHRARGSDFAGTVSESGRRRRAELLAAAGNILETSAAFASADPYFWISRIQLAGFTCDGLDRVVRAAVVRERRFPHIFITAAYFYLPRWCGSATEFRAFAEFAADATKADFGDALYPLVAWTALDMEEGNAIELFGLDWQRMRRGFEDFLKRFPDATIWHQRFAYAAWRASDRAVARRLFATPHLGYAPAVDESVWQSVGNYRIARDWAMKDPVEDLMRPVPVPTTTPVPRVVPRQRSAQQPAPPSSASALRKPSADSWITAAAVDWPPLFLTNRLELRDGTVIENFNSFLVDTGDGVVAITSTPTSSDRDPAQPPPPGVRPWKVPLSLTELRAEMKVWTMSLPAQARPALSVGSIENMPMRGLSRTLVLSVKSAAKQLPVRVLKPATNHANSGRVYVVACTTPGPGCRQTAYTAQIVGASLATGRKFGRPTIRLESEVAAEHLTGSPVLNEDGLVIAVISGTEGGFGMVGGSRIVAYAAEDVGLVLENAGIWTP